MFPEMAPGSAAARNLLFRSIKRHEAPVVESQTANRRLSRSLTEPSQAIALQMIMRERTSKRQTQTFRSGCIEPANIAGPRHTARQPVDQVWPIGDHHGSSVLCHSDWSPYVGRRQCSACGRVSYIPAQRLPDHAAPGSGLGGGGGSRSCASFKAHGWYAGLSAPAEGVEAG